MCEKQFSRSEVEAAPRFLHLRSNSSVTDDFQYCCIKLYLLEKRLWNTLRHLMVKKYFTGLNNSGDLSSFSKISSKVCNFEQPALLLPNKAQQFSKWKFKTI